MATYSPRSVGSLPWITATTLRAGYSGVNSPNFGVETAGGRSLISQCVISPRIERCGSDDELARWIELAVDDVHFLEVGAVVSHRPESHTLHFSRDVLDCPGVAGGRQQSALHRIVGEDVEASLQFFGWDW